jgi:hypothetical protein
MKFILQLILCCKKIGTVMANNSINVNKIYLSPQIIATKKYHDIYVIATNKTNHNQNAGITILTLT